MSLNISIDGKTCTCESGEFLLEVARRNGFYIPTLCAHESLSEQGCCRVCIVEIVSGERSQIVVSCVYPVERAIEVLTNSEKVKALRGMTLALLQKLAPASSLIAGMCKAYGAPELPRLEARADDDTCILCGLCVKACAQLGTGAIAAVNRGIEKKIATPYDQPSATCIGCASCAQVCPTGSIVVKQDAQERSIWGRTFTLLACDRCGVILDTTEAVAYAATLRDAPPEHLCPDCRKQQVAQAFVGVYGK
ncbi:MAG: (2Fe-2S)-binding protein [Coriobacteriales bacterium]|jgi:NADH dehydrogenase/NADH:ubiquinone oxidoreductase subunit G|nr:(2Fe-2S)-binding protein [Coriobacteriales bacterium]